MLFHLYTVWYSSKSLILKEKIDSYEFSGEETLLSASAVPQRETANGKHSSSDIKWRCNIKTLVDDYITLTSSNLTQAPLV